MFLCVLYWTYSSPYQYLRCSAISIGEDLRCIVVYCPFVSCYVVKLRIFSHPHRYLCSVLTCGNFSCPILRYPVLLLITSISERFVLFCTVLVCCINIIGKCCFDFFDNGSKKLFCIFLRFCFGGFS